MSLAELFSSKRHVVCEGLLDRVGLSKIAEQEMEKAEQSGETLALMLVEIDHFDRLRSAWGAVAGDRVLDAVGKELTQLCGGVEGVGRLRSQEFAVLLPGYSADKLSTFAEHVRSKMQSMIGTANGEEITVSVGVGMFYRGEKSWKQMLCRADVALFCAKNSGCNRVVLDTGSPRPIGDRRAAAMKIAA